MLFSAVLQGIQLVDNFRRDDFSFSIAANIRSAICMCVGEDEDQSIAVHAVALEDQGVGPQMFNEIALVVCDEECFVCQVQDCHLDCFK